MSVLIMLSGRFDHMPYINIIDVFSAMFLIFALLFLFFFIIKKPYLTVNPCATKSFGSFHNITSSINSAFSLKASLLSKIYLQNDINNL